jgi:hypothetical protein
MDVSWAVHITMLAAVAMTACQKGEGDSPTPKVSNDPYAQDIGRLCNAEKLSGADQQPEEARSMHIAQWLGGAIETQEGLDFLASIAPLQGAAKGDRLRDEARRVGVGACALAASWR